MTRREATKFGTLFALGLALGKMDALKAEQGQLVCDLAQWPTIKFKYHGEVVSYSTKEVFDILKGSK